jgi:uncharacterized protein YggE
MHHQVMVAPETRFSGILATTKTGGEIMLRLFVTSLLLVISCQVSAGDGEMPRTISVNGKGFATVKPDMARLSLSVVERDQSLAVAQRSVADVTARVLALLDELGVERKYIDSTGATVRPNYRWNRDTEQQELIGYIAERRIDIEVRDLNQLGKVVESAVNTGVNRVSPPVLDSTERRKVYREALARAADDARDNAGVLADSFGVTLGPVIRIDAGGPPSPPRPMMRVQQDVMATAELAPETYNAGDIRFDTAINAVFSLQ